MKKNNNKTVTNKVAPPAFPESVLKPISNFLSARLHTMEKRKKEISKEDPFSDTGRVDDNAAPDTEADEQFGHARTSALGKEIGKSIVNIRKALTRIKLGKYGICEECGQLIDTERLMANPTATLCTKDAAKREE